MLQIRCRECGWTDKPRIPEQKRIKTFKMVTVDQFHGFNFEIFDKYGHVAMFSQSYSSRQKALDALCDELPRMNSNGEPYTAVLWPSEVKVEGERFTVGTIQTKRRKKLK
jgi:hypothetical protein